MIPDRIPTLRPQVGEQEFPEGRKPHDLGQHYEVLAVFDHDFEGWHALVQCWNHDERADAKWEYGLVLCCRELDWEPRLVYDWETTMPKFAEVAALIDRYLEAPEVLRFLLR